MNDHKDFIGKNLKLTSVFLAIIFTTSAIASNFDNTRTLANKGDVQAQIEVADNYRYPDLLSEGEPEYSKAFDWYMRAANQGSTKLKTILQRCISGAKVSPKISLKH